MKVKRITLEVEVPIRTVAEDEIMQVVREYLDRKGIPHQAQVESKISPNPQIGKATEFDPEQFFLSSVISRY